MVKSEEGQCRGNDDRLGMKENARFNDGLNAILFLTMWRGRLDLTIFNDCRTTRVIV
jgi:hypothetical protein